MNEVRVGGPIPRYDLAEWRERFGILAGITGRGERGDFDLGLAGTSAPVRTVLDRWRAFHAGLDEFTGIVVSRQVHGARVHWHQEARGLVLLPEGDGHATATPGLLLAVTVADCIPVYLADPDRRVIALLHAGWRGTAAGILSHGIDVLKAHGASVDNLLMHCGIGICGQCYEVGSEVLAACGIARPDAGKAHLDLRAQLASQARRLGVENVSTSSHCAAHESDRFWSHRASGGRDGRMVAYLGLLS